MSADGVLEDSALDPGYRALSTKNSYPMATRTPRPRSTTPRIRSIQVATAPRARSLLAEDASSAYVDRQMIAMTNSIAMRTIAQANTGPSSG